MKSQTGSWGWVICSVIVAAVPSAAPAQTRRVAVYDFSYTGVRNNVMQIFGSDKPVGAQVANRIIAKLVGSATAPFDVIDRNQIDNIMKEQNLKFSDRFDPRDAPRLGKLLNVDAIVTGSVDELVSQVKNNRVGVGPVGVGKVESVADVTVSVRVISTETGRIFIADQINSHQTSELGKGGQYKNNGGVNGSTSAHPGEISAEHALQAAGDEIGAKILAKAADLPSRPASEIPPPRPAAAISNSPPPAVGQAHLPPAKSAVATAPVETLSVGRIDGSKIYITGGLNAGIKVNDRFDVRRVTGTMKDANGKDIQTDERVDTVVVTDVEDQFAVARSTQAGSTMLVKVGDKLKKARAATSVKKGPVQGKL